MDRRDAMKLGLSTAALVALRQVPFYAQVTELPATSIPTLQALAATVLPSSLGPQGTDRVAKEFADWVRGYREGAPLEHGYGHPRLRFAPPSPASAYLDHLAKLDAAAAAQRPGKAFGTLPRAEQRAVVEAALEAASVKDLPFRPNGQHVASDLMAYYFRSSEANDLCYRADIGQETCRAPIALVKKPKPLA